MKLAILNGENEYVYRIRKNVESKTDHPFIIKTLLKTNFSFQEKKEILEEIGFNKKETLIQFQNLNVYNAALLNVPVYTKSTYLHRNEIAKPDKDLDNLLSYIYQKNPVNLNSIPYDDNTSVLTMLVVLGLSQTLNKALSFMEEKEKKAFINETYIDINQYELSNYDYENKEPEKLAILPVISWNEELLDVLCQHGLDVNGLNKYTGEGLGFYLTNKHMIEKLENSYGFIYDMKQKNTKGIMLKDILKNQDRKINILSGLHTANKNEMIAFVDKRISLLKLSNEDMFNLLLNSFHKDNVTNFKTVYNEFAEKLCWKLPNTEIDLLNFFSCQIEVYTNKSAISKILYVKKDFENRKLSFDNAMVLFNVTSSYSSYSLEDKNQKKLAEWYKKDKINFNEISFLNVFLCSYENLYQLFESENPLYNKNITVYGGELNAFSKAYDINPYSIFSVFEITKFKVCRERVVNILSFAFLYKSKMLSDFLTMLHPYDNEKEIEVVTKFHKICKNFYDEKNNSALKGESLQLLLEAYPKLLENLILSINMNNYHTYNYELSSMLKTDEFLMSVIEKEELNKNVSLNQESKKIQNRI